MAPQAGKSKWGSSLGLWRPPNIPLVLTQFSSFASCALPMVVLKILQNHRCSPGSLYMGEREHGIFWLERFSYLDRIKNGCLELSKSYSSTWIGRNMKHCLWLERSSERWRKTDVLLARGKGSQQKRVVNARCGIWLPLLHDTRYHKCCLWYCWVNLVFSLGVPASKRNQRLSLTCCGNCRSWASLGRQKLSEVQGTKGFKSTRHGCCRERRKNSCYSKFVLLWDFGSQGHKQTFWHIKS